MSFIDPNVSAKKKQHEKLQKGYKKRETWWKTNGLDALKKGKDYDFKQWFSDEDDAGHILNLLIGLTKTTSTISGLDYPEIDLSKVRGAGFTKLVDYMLNNLGSSMGIRPDTPFHANLEGKYPASVNAPFRYMELSALGGGMRMVYDSGSSNLFASIHYSHVALVVATKQPDSLALAKVINDLAGTRQRVEDVTNAQYDEKALSDPLFFSYVTHPKNKHIAQGFGLTKATTTESKTKE